MLGLDLISVAVGAGAMLLFGVVAPKLYAKLTTKTTTVVDLAKTSALKAVQGAASNGVNAIVAAAVSTVANKV